MVDDGTIEGKPANIAGGDFNLDEFHGPEFDSITLRWSRGEHPSEDELLRMVKIDLGRFGRESAARKRVERLAVNTEDTEPTGGSGYLKDPHKTLYPYLFPDDGTAMPEKVRHLLKSHVLNQLEEAFEDPDNFIYFTVYGSGVSYNWDEGGDLDVQMWIDIERFQALNEDQATWTTDDLLAEIRRNVQLVNFPTVKDIGLTAPDNLEEDADGSMLIQYYPKPGKGTKEENLASKPYACYDLETGEWLQEPKPFDPSFYGLHFLEVMPKATDMAIQAEALLDEYERNVLNWQFWFSLYSRYRNPAYQQQYQEAQRNAIMEKAGIKTMFQGIFGGRTDAYSPEGKGIEDERDMLQKLLEVWGIFQRLKHYARAPLPWDEQELPEPPSEDSAESDANEKDGKTADNPEDFLIGDVHDSMLPAYVRWRNAQRERISKAHKSSIDYSHISFLFNPETSEAYFGEIGPNEWTEYHEDFNPSLYEWYPEQGQVNVEWDRDTKSATYSSVEANDDPKLDAQIAQVVQTIWRGYGITKIAVLRGLPQQVNVPGHGKLQFGEHPELQQIAQQYAEQNGIEYNPPREYAKVDPNRAKRIADEYDRMPHNPNDPQVKASYDALIRETMAQYKALVNAGYNFEFYPKDHDPYPNSPREAVMDLHNNKHMYVYPTQQGFGSGDLDNSYHPLLGDSGMRWNGQPVSYNDIFRAVHDVFGHAKEGVGFRADGEENAWRQHSAMYSDLARKALTSETRGQNSWVNYGPHGEANQNANQQDTVYADQKAGLLPDWATYEGDHDHNWRSAAWKIASSLLDTIIAQGGGTFTPEGQAVDFTTGFFVSIKGKELTIPLDDVKEEMVMDYARDWLDNGELLGAWVNEGMLYLDSTRHIEDQAEAIQFGKQERQKAIWDIANGMEVFLEGGTELSPAFARHKWSRMPKFAAWADVMAKAQRIRDAGGVQLQRNSAQHIIGTVASGTKEGVEYYPEIWRQAPDSNTISLWDCTCPWSGFSWGRTRQWKKYEGRPCAHVLALYWEGLSQPREDENEQLQIPGLDPYANQPPPTPTSYPQQPTPIDLNQALQNTVVPPAMPQPMMPQNTPIQQPTKPQKPEQMTITFPGAISKWRKSSALQNGDYARMNKSMIGYDDRGTQYTVPRNSIVEILWSDDTETIAIFSLGSGPLGPHNARIVGETANFSWVPRTRGTAPKRH